MFRHFLFSILFTSVFYISAEAQSVGAACSISGRTQMSATPSEGLIQCRSGTWASATQSVAGTQAPAVIQYQKMMITTVDTCNDANIGFVGYNPTTKAQMICGGTAVGWADLPSSSSSSSGTASNAPVVIGSNGFSNGGSPNYCTQVNGTTGKGTPINYLNSCDTGKVCTASGTCGTVTYEFEQLESRSSHSCAILPDKGILCWGSNGSSQLGDGSGPNKTSPVSVSGGFTWKQVAVGMSASHTCAIRFDSVGYCWGENGTGQIGNGGTTISHTPTAITGGYTWKTLTAGNQHTCGIRLDDSVWCWGVNSSGELGVGDNTQRNAPTQNASGFVWKQISAGASHTCGIRSDDTARCWGAGGGGRLGDNDVSNEIVPALVSGGHTWRQISAGGAHTCAIRSDGAAYCWGNGSNGRLGNGGTSDMVSPSLVSGGVTWKQISAGGSHTCAIRSDDTAYCWGDNSNRQFGNGTTTSSNTPTIVSGGHTWKSISAGSAHTCGIRMDNAIYCWGVNTSGQLGDGTGINQSVPTAIRNIIP